eukprot:5504503-Heterocapsa_arctica.AAC.1
MLNVIDRTVLKAMETSCRQSTSATTAAVMEDDSLLHCSPEKENDNIEKESGTARSSAASRGAREQLRSQTQTANHVATALGYHTGGTPSGSRSLLSRRLAANANVSSCQ